MPTSESLVALLHLSAVVSVLQIAYLGFDHPAEREDELESGLREVEKIAGKIAPRLDTSKWPIGEVEIMFPAAVIFLVAGQPKPLKWLLPVHCVYRLWHIPLLRFYRSGLHRGLMFIQATVVSVVLVSIVGAVVWPDGRLAELADNHVTQVFTYFGLVGSLATSVLIAALSRLQRPDRLLEKCQHLEEVIGKRIQKNAVKSIEKANRATKLRDAFNGSGEQ